MGSPNGVASGHAARLAGRGSLVRTEGALTAAGDRTTISTVTRRYLCDAHVADAILDAPGALGRVKSLTTEGVIELLMLPSMRDELGRTTDEETRLRLLHVPFTTHGAAVFVLGESRLDVGDRLGSEEVGAQFETLRGGNPAHTQDAMMATTAIRDGLILVSNDKKARNRARTAGATVMTTSELLAEFGELDRSAY